LLPPLINSLLTMVGSRLVDLKKNDHAEVDEGQAKKNISERKTTAVTYNSKPTESFG